MVTTLSFIIVFIAISLVVVSLIEQEPLKLTGDMWVIIGSIAIAILAIAIIIFTNFGS